MNPRKYKTNAGTHIGKQWLYSLKSEMRTQKNTTRRMENVQTGDGGSMVFRTSKTVNVLRCTMMPLNMYTAGI